MFLAKIGATDSEWCPCGSLQTVHDILNVWCLLKSPRYQDPGSRNPRLARDPVAIVMALAGCNQTNNVNRRACPFQVSQKFVARHGFRLTSYMFRFVKLCAAFVKIHLRVSAGKRLWLSSRYCMPMLRVWLLNISLRSLEFCSDTC